MAGKESKLKVLVADDDTVVIEFFKYNLKKRYPLGENLFMAKTGNECYALAKEHNPDLIISDTKMPLDSGGIIEECGPEICKRLKDEGYRGVIIGSSAGDFKNEWVGISDLYLYKGNMPDFLENLETKVAEIKAAKQTAE